MSIWLAVFPDIGWFDWLVTYCPLWLGPCQGTLL